MRIENYIDMSRPYLYIIYVFWFPVLLSEFPTSPKGNRRTEIRKQKMHNAKNKGKDSVLKQERSYRKWYKRIRFFGSLSLPSLNSCLRLFYFPTQKKRKEIKEIINYLSSLFLLRASRVTLSFWRLMFFQVFKGQHPNKLWFPEEGKLLFDKIYPKKSNPFTLFLF